MATQEYLVSILSTLLIVLIGKWISSSRKPAKPYKLPPVVPGVPLFGNSFQVPATQQGPWAKALAEKYGEM